MPQRIGEHSPNFVDLAGRRFGYLTVIEFVGKSHGHARWRCRCDCGRETTSQSGDLKRGISKSCGCKGSGRRHTKSSYRYGVWRLIVSRCTNQNDKNWKDYGGRGIRLYEPWMHDMNGIFEYLGDRPSSKHKIDRIHNDGNYEPGNVRWATSIQQNRNRRDNIIIEYRGEKKCLSEWAGVLHMPLVTLWNRLFRQKLSVDQAFTAKNRYWKSKLRNQEVQK